MASSYRVATGSLRLTRRGRLVLWALGALVALSTALIASTAVAGTPDTGVEVSAVTVAPGDTLWLFAKQIAQPGEDTRDVVQELMALNGLTSSGLVAGQQLLLPAQR